MNHVPHRPPDYVERLTRAKTLRAVARDLVRLANACDPDGRRFAIIYEADVTETGRIAQAALEEINALKAQLANVPPVPAVSGDSEDKAALDALGAALGQQPAAPAPATPTPTAPPTNLIDRLAG